MMKRIIFIVLIAITSTAQAQKFSALTPLSGGLATTDLMVVAEDVGGPPYQTRSFTGQDLIDLVPSLYSGSGSLSGFTTVAMGTDGLLFTGSITNQFRVGASAFTVDLSSDRVGIATLGPTNALHVVGSIRMVDGNESNGFVMTSNANGVGSWAAATGDGNGIYDGSGSLSVNPTIVTGGANKLQLTSTIVDGFSVDGTTFSVDGSNNRVGIGTDAPIGKLQINGGTLRDGSWGAAIQINTDGNFSSLFFAEQTNTRYSSIQWTASTSGNNDDQRIFFQQITPNGDDFDFTMNINEDIGTNTPVEAFRIDKFGNVGIRTNLPTSRLHVRGVGATSSTTGFAVDNSSNVRMFTVLDDGNVGIGIAAPTETLDVVGTMAVSDDADFDSNTLFVDASANNVGIGTASPTGKLHIVQAVTTVPVTQFNATSTNTNHRHVFGIDDGDKVMFGDENTDLLTASNRRFEFSNSEGGANGNVMHIYQGGSANTFVGSKKSAFATSVNNGFSVDGTTFSVDGSANMVGIGTAAPSEALDVVGTMAVSDDANFDSNTLFVDASENSIGIGGTPSTFETIRAIPTSNGNIPFVFEGEANGRVLALYDGVDLGLASAGMQFNCTKGSTAVNNIASFSNISSATTDDLYIMTTGLKVSSSTTSSTAGEMLDVVGNIEASGDYINSGLTGASGTFTFGGGTTGDIATMTFTGGILTGTTTVP